MILGSPGKVGRCQEFMPHTMETWCGVFLFLAFDNLETLLKINLETRPRPLVYYLKKALALTNSKSPEQILGFEQVSN